MVDVHTSVTQEEVQILMFKKTWVKVEVLTTLVCVCVCAYLHRAASDVQDLGSVVEVLLKALREGRQTQQVGEHRHRNRKQRSGVDLGRQVTLLLHAGLVGLVTPEVPHLHHLQAGRRTAGVTPLVTAFLCSLF